MKGEMDFNSELCKYPNGEYYYKLFVGIHTIGIVNIVKNGYLVFRKRKPVSTLKEAGIQCLDYKIKACVKEHKLLLELLSCLQAKIKRENNGEN